MVLVSTLPLNPLEVLLQMLLSNCNLVVNTPLSSCNANLPSVESLASPLHYIGSTVLGRDFLIGTRASKGGMQVSSLNPDFSKILNQKAMLPERQPIGTLTWVAYKSWEVSSKQSLVNKWVLLFCIQDIGQLVLQLLPSQNGAGCSR